MHLVQDEKDNYVIILSVRDYTFYFIEEKWQKCQKSSIEFYFIIISTLY